MRTADLGITRFGSGGPWGYQIWRWRTLVTSLGGGLDDSDDDRSHGCYAAGASTPVEGMAAGNIWGI
ncbi:hypothetical protein E2562_007118 [Oryza meyeriana var. granulata]|uniref:Uncharacterized protein n=1 Tax=Oryza meyeriana var. granulata TaxID=110450 RepID=A0A6G1F4Z2_9ORYZ|nr:hypothetical protein E2562_007118 [Oryza meyeriana var. granulata]